MIEEYTFRGKIVDVYFRFYSFGIPSLRIRHAVAAHIGTCPAPMALIRLALAVMPFAVLGVKGCPLATSNKF